MQKQRCCIAGGGPAGVMLGYLLARAGVDVVVLEKHKDFFRDFRGDTIHPSTLELMKELGLLKGLLQIPHSELRSIGGLYGDFRFTLADFAHLPLQCKFITLMPQWDFLNFLTEQGRRFRTFDVRMEHEVVGLLEGDGRVRGVRVRSAAGITGIEADLVVACDGRHSTVRTAANLPIEDLGVPIDVLWFRISRNSEDPYQALGRIDYGKMLILINRKEYYQAGLIVRKGTFDEVKAAGLPAFRASLAQIAPFLKERTDEIEDWEQIKLLSVQINRLRQWHRPGLLCIGDAAHAMSPAGGVGINLAIQDAVAAANLLAEPLRERRATEEVLAKVQQRRELPVRIIQAAQARAHEASLNFLGGSTKVHAPWQLRAFVRIPGLQRILGRVVGGGIRPEHVRTPADPSVAQ